MQIEFRPEVRDELNELRRLSVTEHTAMLTAIAVFEAIGLDLRFPHTSQVKGTKLRELRPRAGRSPWRAFYRRAFYRRVGDVLVVGAIGPEAEHNRRGFDRAVDLAEQRISGS
jgi:hypothetical protein